MRGRPDAKVYEGQNARWNWFTMRDMRTKEEAMSREYAIKQLTRKEKLALMDF